MFGAGYLCGYTMGRIGKGSCGGGTEFKDLTYEREQVFKWLKKHPYSTCQEVAKKHKITLNQANGVLISLLVKGRVQRTQDHKYYITEVEK